MHNFKELKIWQRGREIVKPVYQLTSRFPKDEIYGLTSQIRRAATSISANIAEGAGRKSDKEFVQFLSISQGSCFELGSHLIIASDLEFVKWEVLEPIFTELEELQKMNRAFQSRLEIGF